MNNCKRQCAKISVLNLVGENPTYIKSSQQYRTEHRNARGDSSVEADGME